MKTITISSISVMVLVMGLTQSVWADHFAADFIDHEPPWGIHPERTAPDQHHTHGLIVFEKIHGVGEHLPFFVVRGKGVYGTIRDRTIQLAEKMDMAMDIVTQGGHLAIARDNQNYAIYAEGGQHQRMRVMTITSMDALGYARRSDPEKYANLTAEQLADYVVDHWMDMHLVFYKYQEPVHLVNTEEGKQVIGMMKVCKMMAQADGVSLSLDNIHYYIDVMPGNRSVKEALESLAYRMPMDHGAQVHGEEPDEHLP